MISVEEVREMIANGVQCELLEVAGDGEHFEAVIVSPEFEGQRLLQQHQIVYKALGDRMGGEIHALSMKTYSPSQWQSKE